MASLKDAIWACYRRSLEMGGHDSNVGPGRVSVETPHYHIVKVPHGEMIANELKGRDETKK